MTAEEYFGDWMRVIDKDELMKVMRWIQTLNDSKICLSKKNIFRAFQLCSYNKLRVCCIRMDPYPQPGIAQGVLFGNSKDTPEELLSPFLQVIKECVINYEIPHGPIEFDNTLELWAKQGVLLINSAFTCKVNQIGSHVDIWRPFVSKLIYNLSRTRPDIIFVMFGAQAQSFNKEIGDNTIINVKHPAYYARMGFPMPSEPFEEINRLLTEQGKPKIIYT